MRKLGRLPQGNNDIHVIWLFNDPHTIHLKELFQDLKGILSRDFPHGVDAGGPSYSRGGDIGVSQLAHHRIDHGRERNIGELKNQA